MIMPNNYVMSLVVPTLCVYCTYLNTYKLHYPSNCMPWIQELRSLDPGQSRKDSVGSSIAIILRAAACPDR